MSLFNKVRPNLLIGACLVAQIVLTIFGNVFDWKKILPSPFFLIFGCVIAVMGYGVHLWTHRYHHKAHQTSRVIDEVITEGPFSKIRHPMYLGMLMFFWGGYVAWSYLLSLPVPLLATALIIALAKNEERFLIEKLGSQYLAYKERVRWMFIPHLY